MKILILLIIGLGFIVYGFYLIKQNSKSENNNVDDVDFTNEPLAVDEVDINTLQNELESSILNNLSDDKEVKKDENLNLEFDENEPPENFSEEDILETDSLDIDTLMESGVMDEDIFNPDDNEINEIFNNNQ